ncbi:hypothetical protein [Phycobacter sp. K97]|uniref:hypothetical protein n=1 Tax=Phycobacter sedimenti TaxID=3133977 RepID=UPI00311DD798
MRRLRQLSGFGLFCLALSQPVASSEVDIETADLSREELVARIIAAGTSASDRRRTGVEIDGCMVTTFAHEPYQDFGWVLHTLFEFDIGLVQISRSREGELSMFVKANSINPNMALVIFEAIPPYKVPHEMPAYREPKTPVRRSDREGPIEYFFIENEDFLVLMENVTGPQQGRDFARGLMRLRSEYCLPSSS